jgi:uncharacterized RDD family membrane protein YckC
MAPVTLWKRLVAFTYDSLIVIALLMLATALSILVRGGNPIFPEDGFAYSLFQLYLGLVILGYFVGFWHFGGQTVGMKAWKIRVIDIDTNAPPSIKKALLRALLGVLFLGIGLLPALWRKDRCTIYDTLTRTQLLLTS